MNPDVEIFMISEEDTKREHRGCIYCGRSSAVKKRKDGKRMLYSIRGNLYCSTLCEKERRVR